MQNKSFLVMLVIAVVLALGLAFVTVMYLLSRRSIAEIKQQLRQKESDIAKLKEQAVIEKEQEKQKKLEADIKKAEAEAAAIKESIKEKDQYSQDFEKALQKVKSWDELDISRG